MSTEVMGQKVGPIGYGLLGLTWRASPLSEEEAFASMRAALAAGCNFWNGGEFYGTPEHNSLTLLNKYFEKYPEDADKVVLNIKGGTRPGLKSDGSAAYMRESVENCLKMLGPRGKIHMFEPARRDRAVPLEETLTALAELVKEGKIGGVALSEVNANTIREASKITKIVAVEIELSLWQTDVLHNGIAQTCAELDIPIIAYSPLGRGMLTNQIKSPSDIPKHDVRHMLPRFHKENFATNLKLVEALSEIADKKGCTSGQLAVNWVRTLSEKDGNPAIFPIPGSTKVERVKENAVVVDLSADDMAEIEGVLGRFAVVGDRYHYAGMALVDA